MRISARAASRRPDREPDAGASACTSDHAGAEWAGCVPAHVSFPITHGRRAPSRDRVHIVVTPHGMRNANASVCEGEAFWHSTFGAPSIISIAAVAANLLHRYGWAEFRPLNNQLGA